MRHLIILIMLVMTYPPFVRACDEDAYVTKPLPPTPKMIVMDYPRSERAAVFAERVKAMRLWVASNEER